MVFDWAWLRAQNERRSQNREKHRAEGTREQQAVEVVRVQAGTVSIGNASARRRLVGKTPPQKIFKAGLTPSSGQLPGSMESAAPPPPESAPGSSGDVPVKASCGALKSAEGSCGRSSPAPAGGQADAPVPAGSHPDEGDCNEPELWQFIEADMAAQFWEDRRRVDATIAELKRKEATLEQERVRLLVKDKMLAKKEANMKAMMATRFWKGLR